MTKLKFRQKKLNSAERKLRRAQSLLATAAQEMGEASQQFFPVGASGCDISTAGAIVEKVLEHYPTAMA